MKGIIIKKKTDKRSDAEKVIEIRNSRTLTCKLLALRHEKKIKLFLKRSVLKRGMLKAQVD